MLQREKDTELNNNAVLVNGFIRIKRIYTRTKLPRLIQQNLGDEEKTMIQDILDLMTENSGIELRRFNKVDILPNDQGR